MWACLTTELQLSRVYEKNLSDTINFLLNGHLTNTDTYSVELASASLYSLSWIGSQSP